MKNLILTSILLISFNVFVIAQKSAKLYRTGVLIGTYGTIDSALTNATNIGDSILLSAHTFKENNLIFPGGLIMQGTISATDTSKIDAEYKSRIAMSKLPRIPRAVTIIDVVCENGKHDPLNVYGGFEGFSSDSLYLKGHAIVRNCLGQAFYRAYLYDHVKICGNNNDSFGGAAVIIDAFDSVEICHNTAAYGGAVGYVSGGTLTCHSPGVRIHHNTATIAGGAIYGNTQMTAGQITDNQAPMGAAIYTIPCYPVVMQNLRIYNPRLDGTRQNEIYLRSGNLNIDGSWFGQSDTTGLIFMSKDYLFCTTLSGRPAKANWSVNWGKALSKKDTLFPIGAGFTYSDGTVLPAKSCPWLVGYFTSSKGTFLTPKPIMQPNDTLRSLFRTYIYAPKDTGSKPISYVCSIDADTFRVTPMVWGRDTSNLSIFSHKTASQVFVYPNPTTDFLSIQGAAIGSTISLYDLQGKLVKSEELKGNNATIDMRLVAKGNYLLKITTKEGEEGSAKVLKE